MTRSRDYTTIPAYQWPRYRTHIGDGWRMKLRTRPPFGPVWWHRWLEAWWIITNRWSLHRAWQLGKDAGNLEAMNWEPMRSAIHGFGKPASTPQNMVEMAENMVGPEGLEPPTRPL